MLREAGVQAIDSVASLVKTCFGPNGLRALVEGDDGRTTLLHTGNQIFTQYLNNPLMRFIGQGLQCYHHSTGDGSKKIILLLTALLKEIHQVESATCRHRNSIELSRMFHQLEGDLVGCIVPSIISKPTMKVWCVLHGQDSSTKVRVHLEKILNTSIGSCYSYSIRKRLRELLVEFLLTPTSSSSSLSAVDQLGQVVLYYQRSLDAHVVCVDGVSVSQSKLYPGFLLEREVLEPALLSSLQKLPRFKALLLHSDLNVSLGDAAISIASRSDLEGTMDHLREVHSSQAVEWMVANNVRLLLCTARLSTAAVKLLTWHNIAAIQLVDQDLLLCIAEYCGTMPSLDLWEESDRHIMVECTGCRTIHVGRKTLLHLEVMRSKGEFREASLPEFVGLEGLHSILLCAPTLNYCHQLAKIVSNSLQIIAKWAQPVLNEGEACLVSVCGGGAWEMALVRQFQEHINTNKIPKESVLWTAINALQRGLLQIPLALAINASSETARKKNTTQLLCDVGHTHPTMVSPVDGSLMEVQEWESWLAAEPMTMQQEVVLCALNLARQLCRIDGVIPVRRGILLNKSRQEKQYSDSEYDE